MHEQTPQLVLDAMLCLTGVFAIIGIGVTALILMEKSQNEKNWNNFRKFVQGPEQSHRRTGSPSETNRTTTRPK